MVENWIILFLFLGAIIKTALKNGDWQSNQQNYGKEELHGAGEVNTFVLRINIYARYLLSWYDNQISLL